MAIQYLAIVEESTRGTDPGSGYQFLPITGQLTPTFSPTDESRKEFRGGDSALGDLTVYRKESVWTYELECSWYPDNEAIGLLFKYLLGFSGTRSVIDTSAYEGILYPSPNAYAGGGDLEDLGIGIVPNTDEDGTTKAQYYGGGRPTACKIAFSGTDDIKLTFTISGPGEYIGDADQTATSSPTFSSIAPFVSSDALCYIGAGITRTGTAPDFTALDPNTMDSFIPDSVEITITNGLADKIVMNGILGPSKTSRESQFMVEASCPIDYEDPSSGFSSADELKTLFTGTRTNSLLFVLENGVVAGDTTTEYGAIIDLANLVVNADPPERNAEGMTPSVTFNYKSLYSSTTEYPVALFTTDKNSAY